MANSAASTSLSIQTPISAQTHVKPFWTSHSSPPLRPQCHTKSTYSVPPAKCGGITAQTSADTASLPATRSGLALNSDAIRANNSHLSLPISQLESLFTLLSLSILLLCLLNFGQTW